MAERKAVNKYYPPDWTPDKGSLNKYHGTHALRERARKLHKGILIIRFEMPYNIWCEGCNNHIGTGVRYNAEKKKVGMYYSTPVYQFRMKCHLCTNHFEIKTDPQNFDYVIVNGARRQERRWDPSENEQIAPEDKETTNKMARDAMFHLEHGVDDASKGKAIAPSLARLENLQSRWLDDYSANQLLRKQFRTKKKEILVKEENNNALLSKSSLNIPLVDENPQDIHLAKLLKFSVIGDVAEKQKEKRTDIEQRSWFPTTSNKRLSGILSNVTKNIKTHRKSFDTSSISPLSDKIPIKRHSIPIDPKISREGSWECRREKDMDATDAVVNTSVQSLVSLDYNDSDSA